MPRLGSKLFFSFNSLNGFRTVVVLPPHSRLITDDLGIFSPINHRREMHHLWGKKAGIRVFSFLHGRATRGKDKRDNKVGNPSPPPYLLCAWPRRVFGMQVERAFADAAAAATSTPPSPPIRPRPATKVGGGDGGGNGTDGTSDLLDGDDSLNLLTPPPPPSTSMIPSDLAERPADDVAHDSGSGSGSGMGALTTLGHNADASDVAAAGAGGRSEPAAADGLLSRDDGLESDDDYGGDEAELAGSTAVATVEDGDGGGDGVSIDPEDAVGVLPDLRSTASPPLDEDGPGRASSPSARLSLSERLAAARGRAGGGTTAAAAASTVATETKRSFSRRQVKAPGHPSTPAYRGSAKKTGVRTATERETQFLGSQM